MARAMTPGEPARKMHRAGVAPMCWRNRLGIDLSIDHGQWSIECTNTREETTASAARKIPLPIHAQHGGEITLNIPNWITTPPDPRSPAPALGFISNAAARPGRWGWSGLGLPPGALEETCAAAPAANQSHGETGSAQPQHLLASDRIWPSGISQQWGALAQAREPG